MDPNATLQNARLAATAVITAIDGDGDLISAADSLAEHFRALDEWVSRGGFLPQDWRQH